MTCNEGPRREKRVPRALRTRARASASLNELQFFSNKW